MVKPIQFCIPSCKIVTQIPQKTRDFASLIPGNLSTYIYNNETDYYKGYQESYYAVTCKKAGWDCLRHYEILANGSIPYFLDIENAPRDAMFLLPRDLIIESMNIPGVSYLHIDHEKFDKDKYYELLNKLLDYTRKYLTTEYMASYLLKEIQYKEGQKIMFISCDTQPDYMRCLLLIGLKQLLGDKVIDCPKIPHIYDTYENEKSLYGRGMSYTKIIPDLDINRVVNFDEIDHFIYGSVHRGLPFHDILEGKNNVYYICGEDIHERSCKKFQNLFIRE